MASRLTTQEKIEIVFMYGELKNFHEVHRQWIKRFSSEPPSISTIKDLVDKFKETGSVHDVHRSGRHRSVLTNETIQQVEDLLVYSPQTSVRNGAIDLGISKSSFHRSTTELGFRPYRPTTVVELSDDDLDRREEFCSTFLIKLEQEPHLLDKIIWSDESLFRMNGVVNCHNCCYWAPSNPCVQVSIPEESSGVMVWCGLTSSGIIGPYFFDESVTGESYLAMLKEFLWPKIKYKRMLFQQDGAPPHYSLAVRAWLNEKFPGRWLGRRGPLEWPARSPDLTPCDFFLWGYLKNIVYRERPATIEQLRERIAKACEEIPIEICKNACQSVSRRFKRCQEEEGKPQI
jgi:transposase